MAFAGGVFLAIQAGFNTQLGGLVNQPILAVISTSITSTVLSCLLLVIIGERSVLTGSVSAIPFHLWWIGGLFSMTGILIYFYTIPKLGISKMITLGLCGQIIFSVVAGKYGWFDTPPEPVTIRKAVGVLMMIISILLINTK